METKQLLTFKTAAENLNFTQTARMLNFAQSSVTAQIKALESELGAPLFERLGKRLVLTEAGRQFKLYADKIITLTEEAKQVVRGDEEQTGTLVIGAQESQCTYRLPALLKEFKARFPNVKLVFRPSNSDAHAREQLLEGILDIAFIMDSCKPRDALHIETLIREELKIVASPDHPLADAKNLAPKDLEHETFLLTEAGCSYRTILERTFASVAVYPLNKFEFASIEAIKQCVMSGLGIAFLPGMVVAADLREGKLAELAWEAPEDVLFTQIAWHKDKWMTPPLLAFIELTRKVFHAGELAPGHNPDAKPEEETLTP
ncbi:LysR family transcriptional regulator [Paenibacillus chitinolyticus]|uniref:LysR family transcriptional regulator n=1 Tax=Paenibacillus chitinolyticus TaxID=79263 RepID=UPI003D06E732